MMCPRKMQSFIIPRCPSSCFLSVKKIKTLKPNSVVDPMVGLFCPGAVPGAMPGAAKFGEGLVVLIEFYEFTRRFLAAGST